MSTTNAEDLVDVAHASDPIRIVPLHVPEGLLAPLAAAPQHVVSDAKIQHLITRELAAAGGGFPAPDANTLYFVYLPPGVAVVQGGDRSCQAFCGYHNNFTQGGTDIFYAAMPYPGCQGCTGDLAPFDALTSTSSHELCEAVTDPIPGQGWYCLFYT